MHDHLPHVRLLRIILAFVVIYASWLGMMLVHELGHILHALLSGGQVVSVSIPLFGFSLTTIHPDPHELFVVWGGPLWGVMIPLAVCGIVRLVRHVPDVLKFFTGLCLIANGTYIGIGWCMQAGDGKDMVRLGTPVPVMIAFGIISTLVGFLFWHSTRVFTLK